MDIVSHPWRLLETLCLFRILWAYTRRLLETGVYYRPAYNRGNTICKAPWALHWGSVLQHHSYAQPNWQHHYHIALCIGSTTGSSELGSLSELAQWGQQICLLSGKDQWILHVTSRSASTQRKLITSGSWFDRSVHSSAMIVKACDFKVSIHPVEADHKLLMVWHICSFICHDSKSISWDEVVGYRSKIVNYISSSITFWMYELSYLSLPIPFFNQVLIPELSTVKSLKSWMKLLSAPSWSQKAIPCPLRNFILSRTFSRTPSFSALFGV